MARRTPTRVETRPRADDFFRGGSSVHDNDIIIDIIIIIVVVVVVDDNDFFHCARDPCAANGQIVNPRSVCRHTVFRKRDSRTSKFSNLDEPTKSVIFIVSFWIHERTAERRD